MKIEMIANISCFLSYILEQAEGYQLFSLMENILEIFSRLYLINKMKESDLKILNDLLENMEILYIDSWEDVFDAYLEEKDLYEEDSEGAIEINLGDVLIYWTQLVQEYLNNITDSRIQGESVFYF